MKTKKEFVAELTAGDVETFLRSRLDLNERMRNFDAAVADHDETKKIHAICDVDNVFSDMSDCLRSFMRAVKEGDADPDHEWFRLDEYGNVYTIGNITDYITDYMDDVADYMREEYEDELCEYYGYGEEE